jgi:hypothetical protein
VAQAPELGRGRAELSCGNTSYAAIMVLQTPLMGAGMLVEVIVLLMALVEIK